MTKKMVSFRIDIKVLDRLNRLKEPKTDVIHKALGIYLHSLENVNTLHKESVNTKRNTTVNTVNHSQQKKQERPVNQVNQKVNSVQVIEHYELLRHYKEEIDWLRDRVEYFERSCSDLRHDIVSKIDDVIPKKETSSVSWFRM